jgi:hypothetical protein
MKPETRPQIYDSNKEILNFDLRKHIICTFRDTLLSHFWKIAKFGLYIRKMFYKVKPEKHIIL